VARLVTNLYGAPNAGEYIYLGFVVVNSGSTPPYLQLVPMSHEHMIGKVVHSQMDFSKLVGVIKMGRVLDTKASPSEMTARLAKRYRSGAPALAKPPHALSVAVSGFLLLPTEIQRLRDVPSMSETLEPATAREELELKRRKLELEKRQQEERARQQEERARQQEERARQQEERARQQQKVQKRARAQAAAPDEEADDEADDEEESDNWDDDDDMTNVAANEKRGKRGSAADRFKAAQAARTKVFSGILDLQSGQAFKDQQRNQLVAAIKNILKKIKFYDLVDAQSMVAVQKQVEAEIEKVLDKVDTWDAKQLNEWRDRFNEYYQLLLDESILIRDNRKVTKPQQAEVAKLIKDFVKEFGDKHQLFVDAFEAELKHGVEYGYTEDDWSDLIGMMRDMQFMRRQLDRWALENVDDGTIGLNDRFGDDKQLILEQFYKLLRVSGLGRLLTEVQEGVPPEVEAMRTECIKQMGELELKKYLLPNGDGRLELTEQIEDLRLQRDKCELEMLLTDNIKPKPTPKQVNQINELFKLITKRNKLAEQYAMLKTQVSDADRVEELATNVRLAKRDASDKYWRDFTFKRIAMLGDLSQQVDLKKLTAQQAKNYLTVANINPPKDANAFFDERLWVEWAQEILDQEAESDGTVIVIGEDGVPKAVDAGLPNTAERKSYDLAKRKGRALDRLQTIYGDLENRVQKRGLNVSSELDTLREQREAEKGRIISFFECLSKLSLQEYNGLHDKINQKRRQKRKQLADGVANDLNEYMRQFKVRIQKIESQTNIEEMDPFTITQQKNALMEAINDRGSSIRAF
jgi:hypothetical protein